MHRTIRLAAIVVAVVLAAVVLQGGAPQPAPEQPAATPQAPDPVPVTVVDRTRDSWHGLAAAVAGWDQSPLVDLRLADTCTAGAYCVVVDAWDHQHSGWAGLSTPVGDRAALVQLNTSADLTRTQQTAVACHELGHALGVGHPTHDDPAVTGCIAAVDPAMVTPTASAADRSMLGADTLLWGAL